MKRLTVESGLGRFILCERDGFLCEIRRCEAEEQAKEETPLLVQARDQLLAYLSGARRGFDLPCRAEGTAFEQAVWRELSLIPYGQTRSYGEIAARLSVPGAARAVGRACGKNPLLIVVPCHRVISSAGKLTGFAAGVEMKQALLALEKGMY